VRVSSYRFGVDQSAAERLRLVAEAYEPVSRRFLTANAPSHPNVALDIGCGPGFTTELLGQVSQPNSIFGIDSSERFIAIARTRIPAAQFVTHDVTDVPLPGAPADVIYARLLLAHLPAPEALVRQWQSQLTTEGQLLIEDLDSVSNPVGPLHDYEDISARIVRSGGGLMYAGALLSHLGGTVVPVTVPGATAALIYLFNVRHWSTSTRLPVDVDELRELERGLVRLSGEDDGTTVSWNVRQLVLGPLAA
jgi:SAM-dependent methyltransferase